MKKQPSLEGKVIIVVGATGGIGRVLCKKFLEAGARVVLASRTRDKLNVLQKSLQADFLPNFIKGKTLVVPTDASDFGSVEHLFDTVETKWKQIDGIVISAGSWARLGIGDEVSTADDLTESHYQGIYLPTFRCGFVAQQHFRKQGHGLIANISSHAAIRLLEENLSYAPFKAAAHHFMLNLNNELKGSNVRATDIMPAIVRTKETEALLKTAENKAEAVQPEDIADWIIRNFNNPKIPAEKLFDSKVVLD